MAFIQFDFESQYLHSNTTVGIIMPDRPKEEEAASFYGSGKKYRVLWLLHGTYGDSSDWIRKSMVELYACEHDLVCVMPSAANSDYTSWDGFGLGYDMESHLVKELMPLVYGWLPVSAERCDNFIAGLSMGGLGVLSYILRYPELFASGAVLSACPVPSCKWDWDGAHPEVRMGMCNPRFRNQVENAGGKDAFLRRHDLWSDFFRMAAAGTLPPLLFACGTEDHIFYDDFVFFRKECERRKADVRFMEKEGYGHEWRFWDQMIEKAIGFFLKDSDSGCR